MTVGELLSVAASGEEYAPEENILWYEAEEKDKRWFKSFTGLIRHIYDVWVEGIEKLRKEEQYIFCPNHESYFDALYVAGAFDGTREVYTLAARELFQRRFFRRALHALNGIAINRGGDNSRAWLLLKERMECENKSVLIHPEGTRSRTGELGKFKAGAAKLALDTGVKLAPVRIDGAYEIYPPGKRIPRLFDFKQHRKYVIRIRFGTPIEPDGKCAEELMQMVRAEIEERR